MKILKILCSLWVFLVLTVCAVYWAVPNPLPAVLHWPVSPVLLDTRGELFHARLSGDDEWCLPIPVEEMGFWLPKVAVAVEDKRFYAHRGVDILSLGRAIVQNISRGRVVSGASTITSQLVRISQPRPRTIGTKVMEFLAAWKLETRLGKRQILELYLNRAPFGGPIRGVEAASRLYFGKRAKDLSLGEASLLVGMLKGPTAHRPDRYPERALQRRQTIIAQVAEATAFSPELTALALKEPLPAFRTAMPQKAWHFADLVVQGVFRPATAQGGAIGSGAARGPYFDASSHSVASRQQQPLAGKRTVAVGQALAVKDRPERTGRLYSAGIVSTTLDSTIQTSLELALERSLVRMDPAITAAGIVVENATGAIRGYVGNARFNPAIGRDWVDCAIAPRSPGSTLKPFIYLDAMEKGLLVPETLLADTPLSFKGQAPRNFSRTYLGPVSTRFALAHSLNAPAVRVQRMLGVHSSLRALRAAGFSQLRQEGSYGDSLVLGAGEVTLLELARAYTALASLGMDKPLVFALAPSQERQTEPQASVSNHYLPSGLGMPMPAARPDARRLYSQPAAWLIADILGDATRLPFITQLTQAREERPIAFKTGTSFGLRDAWCAAYFPGYTVVVWFGQAKGGSNTALVGISVASPVALQLARELARSAPGRPMVGKRWYESPDGIFRARVCALSGAAPSAYCPNIVYTSAIEGIYRTTPCALHALRDGAITILWPPELEDFAANRMARQDMSRPPHIVSPLPGVEYLITPGVQNESVLLLAEGVAYPVYWYAGGQFLGKQENPKTFVSWLPTPGTHTISLLDSHNKSTSLSTTVIDLARQTEENRIKPLF